MQLHFKFSLYDSTDTGMWNEFVENSRNGTFLFNRAYMDYHADRFTDASWLIWIDAKLVALFPANRVGDEVVSHGGLTYGGFILSMNSGTEFILNLFDQFFNHLFQSGIKKVLYKTIPSIYHRLPAEEDRYALFRCGARLVRRDLLSVVSADAQRLPKALRRSITQRARATLGLSIETCNRWEEFWTLLQSQLVRYHGVQAVHCLNEIILLAERFPSEISLMAALIDECIVAGAVLFETPTVIHVQYLAADDMSRKMGLLDLVLENAITQSQSKKKFFDFGISTLNNGYLMNKGLVFYKESFGARTIVHDFYEINSDDYQL